MLKSLEIDLMLYHEIFFKEIIQKLQKEGFKHVGTKSNRQVLALIFLEEIRDTYEHYWMAEIEAGDIYTYHFNKVFKRYKNYLEKDLENNENL